MKSDPKRYSPERFDALAEKTFKSIMGLAHNKGREYSGTEDRLRNFRKIADEIGISKETVLYTYMKKHWDSVTTWVKDIEAGEEKKLSEPIESRIYDLIVYLLLLRAMVDERSDMAKPAPVFTAGDIPDIGNKTLFRQREEIEEIRRERD